MEVLLMRVRLMSRSSALWMAPLLALLAVACTTSPTGRAQFMLVSPQAAISASQQAYVATVGGFAQNNQLSRDRAVAARVREVTGRVVHVAIEQFPSTADWAWSVAVIEDPKTVNAWCMAGGRMAVYTGLLEQLKLTDDELAHIMGHEVSHAIANHTAEQMSRAMAADLALQVGGAVVGANQQQLSGAALAAQLALDLPNSRTAESEADQIGTELAIRAGYDPDAVLSLWQKMGSIGGGQRPPEFLSTHPAPQSRQAALAELIEGMRGLNPRGMRAPVHSIDVITAVR
ncbi:MAG: M48 family metallopeptidase [Pseudomonadota bacterium]